MDESRKAFESWLERYHGIKASNSGCANMIEMYWQAWKASREVIEIELPMPKYTWRSDDYSQGFDKGLAEQRKNDTDAIHAAGIKVKE